ncbi:MAG: hypothetical protein JXQ87_12620 [Bacteroidia bacterium]
MRLKNISDQDVVSLIKKGDYTVLPTLFERNYVNALNQAEKLDFSQKKTQKLLANSCVIIWQFFSSNTWNIGRHKIDFTIDYVFRRLLQHANPHAKLKIKSVFEELDPAIESFFIEPNEEEVSSTINNFKVLKENYKQLIWNHFFEKRPIEKAAIQLNIDEDKAESQLNIGLTKWAELIKFNLKRNIDIDLLKEHSTSLLYYSTGGMSKDAMLSHELKLSNINGLKKLQDYIDELGQIASLSRRLSLVDYLFKNASTKLTGNIWGNKASIASAIFIVLIGILVWISDNTPDNKKDLFKLNEQVVTDTLNQNLNEDSIP